MNATIFGDTAELESSDWELLQDVITQSEKSLSELNEQLRNDESADGVQALDACLSHLDRISVVAGQWQLTGLVRLCRELHICTGSLATEDLSQIRPWIRTLISWCRDVQAYMEDSSNLFRASKLLFPLPEDQQVQLKADLGFENILAAQAKPDDPADSVASTEPDPVPKPVLITDTSGDSHKEDARLSAMLLRTAADLEQVSQTLLAEADVEVHEDAQQACLLLMDNLLTALDEAGKGELSAICSFIKAHIKSLWEDLDTVEAAVTALVAWCDLANTYLCDPFAADVEDLAWDRILAESVATMALVKEGLELESEWADDAEQDTLPVNETDMLGEAAEVSMDMDEPVTLPINETDMLAEPAEVTGDLEEQVQPVNVTEMLAEQADVSGDLDEQVSLSVNETEMPTEQAHGDRDTDEQVSSRADETEMLTEPAENTGDMTQESPQQLYDMDGFPLESFDFEEETTLAANPDINEFNDVESPLALSDDSQQWPDEENLDAAAAEMEELRAALEMEGAELPPEGVDTFALLDSAASESDASLENEIKADVESSAESMDADLESAAEDSAFADELFAVPDTEEAFESDASLENEIEADVESSAESMDAELESAAEDAAFADDLLAAPDAEQAFESDASLENEIEADVESTAEFMDAELESAAEDAAFADDLLAAPDAEQEIESPSSLENDIEADVESSAESMESVSSESEVDSDEDTAAPEDFDLSEFFSDDDGTDGTAAGIHGDIGLIDDDMDFGDDLGDVSQADLLSDNAEISAEATAAEPDEDFDFEAELDSSEQDSASAEAGSELDDDFDFSPDGESAEAEFDVDNILDVLRVELMDVSPQISGLEKTISATENNTELQDAVDSYIELIERIMAASESLGLDGLYEICNFIIDNISQSASMDLDARQKMSEALSAWPGLVLSYLQEPEDDSGCVMLINHLQNASWHKPIRGEKGRDLYVMLSKGLGEMEQMEDVEERQATASAEDVALIMSEDSGQDLIDAFFYESPTQTERFSECMSLIVNGDDVAENVKQAQRIAHTLKGSANLIGVKGIANLTHHIEDILEYLSNHHMTPPPALAELLIESGDCLEAMIEALQGKGPAPDNSLYLLQTVLDWANRIDKGQLRKDDKGDFNTPQPKVEPTAAASEAAQPEENVTAKSASAEMLRVPTHTVDDMIGLLGEVSIAIGQVQEHINRLTNRGKTMGLQDTVIQQRRFDLENLVDVRSMSNMQKRMRKLGGSETESFDPLEMDQYDELYGTAHSYIEAVADSREITQQVQSELSTLEGLFLQQQRLNKELQQIVMTTRMISVSSIESRLHRAVRQACRTTGKKVEMQVLGSEMLIDSDVLTKLADPLMHMLRNAVDHGIEDVETRVSKGKPEVGSILLSFSQVGNNVVCRCVDDGKGLDYEKIYATAVSKGLMPETDNYDKKEVARMIMVPGFSTRESATQISGRGVGMDVVHTAILDLKGALDIEEAESGGTQFSMSLPISLVTSHSLVVRIGEERFAIPTSTLVQILPPDTGDISQVGQEMAFRMGRDVYPAHSLASLINSSTGVRTVDSKRIILLVRADAGNVAISVDQLINSFELVIKSTGRYVSNVRGVSGVAVLGDGSAVPVLNLQDLLRGASGASMGSYQGSSMNASPEKAASVADVLIVDDSLSVRKSLSQFVQDSGFKPMVARDGLEAVEVLRKQRPVIVLVDMEMPRMNGLELTRHIRATEELKHLPVIMITSRTQQKHRQQAEEAGVSNYLSKPYSEDDLLAAMEDLMALAG